MRSMGRSHRLNTDCLRALEEGGDVTQADRDRDVRFSSGRTVARCDLRAFFMGPLIARHAPSLSPPHLLHADALPAFGATLEASMLQHADPMLGSGAVALSASSFSPARCRRYRAGLPLARRLAELAVPDDQTRPDVPETLQARRAAAHEVQRLAVLGRAARSRGLTR